MSTDTTSLTEGTAVPPPAPAPAAAAAAASVAAVGRASSHRKSAAAAASAGDNKKARGTAAAAAAAAAGASRHEAKARPSSSSSLAAAAAAAAAAKPSTSTSRATKSDHDTPAAGKTASSLSSSRRERGESRGKQSTGRTGAGAGETIIDPSLVATLGSQHGKVQMSSKRGNASAGPLSTEAGTGGPSSLSRMALRRTKSSDEGTRGSRAEKKGENKPPSSSSQPRSSNDTEPRGRSSDHREMRNSAATSADSNSSGEGDHGTSSTHGDGRGQGQPQPQPQHRTKRAVGPGTVPVLSSSSSRHKSEPEASRSEANPPMLRQQQQQQQQQQPMATPSSRIRTGFEVDAPPRHHRPATSAARKGMGAGTGMGPSQSSRRVAQRIHSSGSSSYDPADLSNSRHRSLMEGLTDEQRAWAGIEALLMSNDCDSVDTRDVLPDAIIRAMAANRSVSTLETACFLDAEKDNDDFSNDSNDDDDHPNAIQNPGHAPGGAHAGLPGLVDVSFSSLKSETTKQTVLTVATAATQNYVLPSRQKNALASYRPNCASSMNAYMSQLCSQHHQQRQQQRQQQQQQTVPVHVPSRYQPRASDEHEEDPTETEESIDLFANEDTKDEEGTVDGEDDAGEDDEQDGSNADGEEYDEEEEGEDDEEDDDESDDRSRVLIQQYTHHRSFTRNHQVPDLMNASFSSVRTEMSGIMSLISTARNYVVQQDDVNPMGVFLGNITRNLERKQEASLVDDDKARVRYMYERDEIADVRRQILEEEIERYHQGEYDGWHHDEPDHAVVQGQRPDEVSVPSLEPMKPSDDMSPLPSPYSNVTPPFDTVRPTPAGDWRAWVDGAFKPGTTSLSPVPFHPSVGGEAAPSKNRPASTNPKRKKVAKKKPTGSQQPQQQRPGPGTGPGTGTAANCVVRKAKRVEAGRPRDLPGTHGSRPQAAAAAPSRPDPHFDLHAPPPEFDEEEVISLSRLRVPVSSCSLMPSDLPRAMPSPGRSTMLGSPTKDGNKGKAKAMKRKDRHYDPKASPLVSLRQRMARLYTFGKGARRGSPASVLDYGGSGGGGGIAAGRGDESRFFPTIEEEDEEDWSNQLLPHHSSG